MKYQEMWLTIGLIESGDDMETYGTPESTTRTIICTDDKTLFRRGFLQPLLGSKLEFGTVAR
jgi:hypothetical protein